MALNFPSSPTTGQTYTSGGRTWEWDGTTWIAVVSISSAVASGVIYENNQTVSINYTLTAGKNGMSAGAITIASGITVTVPAGATWVIV